MADPVRIQALSHTDATAACQLTQQLRWPHRVQDWAQMINWANQHGMTRGLFHQQQLIGTALCWHWGNNHANLGLMIIHPQWQKQGLGLRLLKHMLDAHAGLTFSLMATDAGLPLYTQLGFKPLGRNTQYQGVFQATEGTPPFSATETRQISSPSGHAPKRPTLATPLFKPSTPRLACSAELDALIALDTRWRGLDRGWLLRELLLPLLLPSPSADIAEGSAIHEHDKPSSERPSSDATAHTSGQEHDPSHQPPANTCTEARTPPCAEACAVLSGPDGQLRAYGVRRHFGRGWLIGPLLAPDPADAIALLDWLCAPLAGAFVRLDLGWQPLPQVSQNPLHHWLIAHGLSIVDQPLAMRRPAHRGPAAHGAGTGISATETNPSGPALPGFPAAPALATLISQATG